MVRQRAAGVLFVVAVAGIVAAGCDTSEQGSPTTRTTDSSAPATSPASGSPVPTTLPFAGAPKVANPVDATKFLKDPCLALTSAQTKQLNVGQGKTGQAPLGMSCVWSNLDTGGFIDLQFNEKFREGLSAVYRGNDDGNYVKFEPVADVVGFPGVIIEIPNSPQDVCTIAIGVSDDLALQLGVEESFEKRGKVDPCVVTKAVAPLVMQTMKAGA